MQFADENFVIEWTKAGFYFQTYNGPYDLLNKIRGEITLFEDVEFTPEVIIVSIKAMLDSVERS
jgi:hypothetical protein